MRLCSSVTALTRLARKRFAVAGSTCVYSSSNWSINSSSCEPSSGNTRSTARCSPWSPASCSSNDGGGSTATPSSASSSCSNGWGAGVISIVNHEPDSGTAPRRIAGSSPAFTALDLPLPLGPTTAMKRPRVPLRPRRAISRSTSRSRPKKSTASTASNASQSLVRVVDRRPRLERRRPWCRVAAERLVQIVDQVADALVAPGWRRRRSRGR